MDAATLAALKGSIAKWKGIVNGTGIDDGPNNCPLCAMFNNWFKGQGSGCDGCPVAQSTGMGGCSGSPYAEYEDLREEDPDGWEPGALDARKNEVAREELDFLISLLPEEETP